jgi:hypothetical protein
MITLPLDHRKYTDATEAFVLALNAAFPTAGSMGIYNRRYISGTTTWTQHSWGNAVDITSPAWMLKPPLYASAAEAALPKYADHMAYMDRVNQWIMTNAYKYHVRYRAWRRYMHYNHIHVDFNPKQYGTPPILTANGDDEVAFAEYLEGVQTSLNEAGFRDGFGRELKVDGVFGPNTLAAIKKRDVAAALAPVVPEVVLDVDTVRVVKGVRLA